MFVKWDSKRFVFLRCRVEDHGMHGTGSSGLEYNEACADYGNYIMQ